MGWITWWLSDLSSDWSIASKYKAGISKVIALTEW